MISFFESFAQIGLPGEIPQHSVPKKSKSKSDMVCYVENGEEVCFNHEELNFAILW